MNIFFIFILTFCLSFIILIFSLNFLKKNLADIPNSRSSHSIIKPNGGGFIFVLNALISSIIYSNYLFLLNIPLSIISLIDDKFNLSRKVRLSFHLLTALSLVIFLISQDYSFFIPKLLTFPILLLLGTSIINFSNFMDGIDGIVGGCYFVIFTMASITIDKIYVPLAASILAFLILNWYPSKLFMGDVGSTFLGAMFFTVLLKSQSLLEGFAFLLISIPLMLDAFICILRRYKNGKNIFKPHRDHLYQRLKDNNFPDSKISLIYILATLLISLSYLFFGINIAMISSLIVLVFGIIIDKKFAIKFT
tara:strand:+ start:4069 stop:4989 length:921 start_codon:yes stop_codon:yes gene_type:complete